MLRSVVLRLLMIAGLVVPTTALLSAAPAGAATESCTLKHTTTVTPGLGATPTAQTFKAKVTLSACHGQAGITSGTGTATLHSVKPKAANCASLSQNGNYAQGTGAIHWNNGKTSSGTLRVTVDAPTHGKLSGKVTSGLFVGKAFGGSASFTPQNGACTDQSRVTKLAGSGTITVG